MRQLGRLCCIVAGLTAVFLGLLGNLIEMSGLQSAVQADADALHTQGNGGPRRAGTQRRLAQLAERPRQRRLHDVGGRRPAVGGPTAGRGLVQKPHERVRSVSPKALGTRASAVLVVLPAVHKSGRRKGGRPGPGGRCRRHTSRPLQARARQRLCKALPGFVLQL